MIQSNGLAHQHPGGPLLRFADIDVPQAGTLLLRGPSGSGKSTWLALAAGLMRPQAGQLRVAGQDMGALGASASDRWRARCVGLLPQRLHLSDALSVRGNLELVYHAAGLPNDRQRLDAVVQALGISELQRRLPTQLSGGQAQRVALARAVLLQPRVLLVDEPTAALDDAAARAALDLLCACAQQHRATLVVATHDARVVSALAHAQVLELTP